MVAEKKKLGTFRQSKRREINTPSSKELFKIFYFLFKQ